MEACSTAFTGSLASLLRHEIQALCNSLVIQREPVVRALCRRKTSETSDSVLCAGCSVSGRDVPFASAPALRAAQKTVVAFVCAKLNNRVVKN